MQNVQDVVQQVLAQAGAVVVIVALLRLALRRVFRVEPDGDGLLALNLLANAIMTVVLLLQSGADFGQPATWGTLALVALGATVVAHGGYDLVASRAKGDSGTAQPADAAQAPSPAPVQAQAAASDYPPGVSFDALGLPSEPVA